MNLFTQKSLRENDLVNMFFSQSVVVQEMQTNTVLKKEAIIAIYLQNSVGTCLA